MLHRFVALVSRRSATSSSAEFRNVPVVDISPLVALGTKHTAESPAVKQAVKQIYRACKDVGFFYISGHGVDPALTLSLEGSARDFFKRPVPVKREIEMAKARHAWRGYFEVGEELTSGKPDQKEGIYFGEELGETDPRVLAKLPMHGRSLFPSTNPEMKPLTLAYIDEMKRVSKTVLRGIALSLDLPFDLFEKSMTAHPLCLFRIFNYPRNPGQDLFSVGAHNDYGLITILYQDSSGESLQVQNRDNAWIVAPPLPNTYVVNLGDMMELITFGLYRSTLHRAINVAAVDRISMPFFFDPDFAARVEALPLSGEMLGEAMRERERNKSYIRWDFRSMDDVRANMTTYGDYILGKVGKVFPSLAEATIHTKRSSGKQELK